MSLARDRLAAVRLGLDDLKSRDVALSIHGAGGRDGHHYDEKAVLSESELRQLETQYGVSLPDDLREFLRRVHGGGAGPGYGLYVPRDPEEIGDMQLTVPFPYGDADATANLNRRATEPYAMLPSLDLGDRTFAPGVLPLAHEGCGMFDLLVITGEQRGRMWGWDRRYCPLYDGIAGPVGPRGHFGFLDWYEDWLSRSLRQVTSRPSRR